MEHSPLDMMDLVHLLHRLSATHGVVRVPWNDKVTIKRVLDAGATTLLVPFVQDAGEAARAVAAARYLPDVCAACRARARIALGTTPNYLRTANRGIAVIAQLRRSRRWLSSRRSPSCQRRRVVPPAG